MTDYFYRIATPLNKYKDINRTKYNMKEMHRSLTFLIIAAIYFAGCSSDNAANEKLVKYVKTEKIRQDNNVKKYVFNGKVKEKNDVTLSFRVGGPLSSINVEVGDYVKEGDVVATIDKRDYQIQLQSAEAQLKQMEGEYNRYKELYNKKKLPANSYEKIESGYQLAKIGYKNAVNQLNDTRLKSPVSGYVYKKFISNHETTGPGQPIISVIDVSKLEVMIKVPASRIRDIGKCNKNYADVKNAGVYNKPVELLSVNEKTGADELYEVRFSLNNSPENTILSGMSAKVTMHCEEGGNSNITVPVEAVFHRKKRTHVWILNPENSTINSREISVGDLKPGGRLEVISGLKNNEVIIAAGVNTLVENQQVKVLAIKSETNIGGVL